MLKRLKHLQEGELFTAHKADFLRELRLSCREAAALFSQSEGRYLVASEIGPALPCPIGETLLSIPALMNPETTEMRARRARAYSRYLKAVRDGVVDQTRTVAELQARAGNWDAWFRIRVWLRGRIGCELAALLLYGVAYRVGIHCNFERRTAALSQLISLLDS